MKMLTTTILTAGFLLVNPAIQSAGAADRRQPMEERLQQLLRSFPEADLNKDGKSIKLTPEVGESLRLK